MITVADDVQNGDIVYAWVSPYKEKAGKKHEEAEYRYDNTIPGAIKLVSLQGTCWSVYPKDMVETWNGNIRKAKIK